jgi:hypothetical protein
MSWSTYASRNRSRRYGLQRMGQWLMPPADGTAGFTDDPASAWVAFNLDEALRRQVLLRQTVGLTTYVRSLP